VLLVFGQSQTKGSPFRAVRFESQLIVVGLGRVGCESVGDYYRQPQSFACRAEAHPRELAYDEAGEEG